MKRGDSVRLTNGKDKGIVLLSPAEVDEVVMCLVAWGPAFSSSFTWERVEDLVLC
jgi:hypothetical protein